MNIVRVVSAITARGGVTLYLADGRTINLPARSYRTEAIMREIACPLAERKQPEIDLDLYSIEARIENRTGGFVSFLKRKWKDFAAMFGGKAPDGATPEADTLVAVVNGVEIPGMEKIERQLEHAAYKDCVGLQKFLGRLSTVINERGHTVQELLDFLSKGDLPIADDGMIVAYKSLVREGDHYLDCHSRSVRQRVGSLVRMDVNMVDPNRRIECSHGLHVGRRDYMGQFSGDVMTLILIDPADVVAVPLKDPSKMRVRAYQIVGELTEEGRQLIRQNKPMTSVEADAKLLASVLRGERVPVIETVDIGKNGMVIDIREEKPAVVPVVEEKAHALDDSGEKAEELVANVRETVKEVVEQQNAAAAEVTTENVSADPAKPEKAAKPKSKKPKKGSYDHIPEKWRQAYIDVTTGKMSQREAEKVYRISAKKLRALIRENAK